MDESINISLEPAKPGDGSNKPNTEDIFPNQVKDVTLNGNQYNNNVEMCKIETNTCKSTTEKNGLQCNSLNENVDMGKEKEIVTNLPAKNVNNITKIEPIRTQYVSTNKNKNEDIKKVQEENNEHEMTYEILLNKVNETAEILKLKEVDISKNSDSLHANSNTTSNTQDLIDPTSKCLIEFEKVYLEVQKKYDFESEDYKPLESINEILDEEYIASSLLNDPIVDIDKLFSDDLLNKDGTYFNFQETKNSTVNTINSEAAMDETKYPENITDLDVISISSDDSCNVECIKTTIKQTVSNTVNKTLNNCVIEISDDDCENHVIQENNTKAELLIKEWCPESVKNNLENISMGDSRHCKDTKTSKEIKNIEDIKENYKIEISENNKELMENTEDISAEGIKSIEKDESSKESDIFKEDKTEERTRCPQKLKGFEKPNKKTKTSNKIQETTKGVLVVSGVLSAIKEVETAKENESSKQKKRIKKDESAKKDNRFKGDENVKKDTRFKGDKSVKESETVIKDKRFTADKSVKESETVKNHNRFKEDESVKENESSKQQKRVKKDKNTRGNESAKQQKRVKEDETTKENERAKQQKRVKDDESTKENEIAKQQKRVKEDENTKGNESAKQKRVKEDENAKGNESAKENERAKKVKRFKGNESCNDEGFKGDDSIVEELLETISLKSNKSESDDGYNSSDFEFITEEEAKKNLLVIDSDLPRSNLNSAQFSIKRHSNCEAGNMYGNSYKDEKDNSPDENCAENYVRVRVVPQEEDLVNIFRNLPPMPVSEIHMMENKSMHIQIPMLVRYEGIGFDMDLMMQDSSDDDVVRGEAGKTMEKIFEMNPDENEHISRTIEKKKPLTRSRTIARDRPGCSKEIL